ncbi:MAG: ABC transporter ATP-binding protein [Flavobacteriales bacterium]
MSVLLDIDQLKVSFKNDSGWQEAVKGISFNLHRGETLGIVGESGSGKSVTSLAIMRLLSSAQSRIEAEKLKYTHKDLDVEILKLKEQDVRKIRGKEISMIFQEPMTSLNPVLTCGEQVAESLRLHLGMNQREAKNRTIELFTEVQLPRVEEMYRAYPHQLSGGQKQRVMIAMAIACNPSILIADEPTTALDVTVQKNILELIKKIQSIHGMGVIFITHDLGVVAEIADRVLVMHMGVIVEQGTVSEIFHKPQHPYTKGLLACRPPLDVRLKRLPVVADFMEVQADGRIIEKASMISLKENIVDEAERKKQHQKLYAGPPILKVENLCTWFEKNQGLFSFKKEYMKAVDDVSFDVFEGETLGLVGESGCGKTTLGRTILKLIEPHSGKIFFQGKDITHFSPGQMRPIRKDIQLIFQDPYSSLNPRMMVGEAIMEPLRVHGIGKKDSDRKDLVMNLLEKVSLLPEHFYRYPHEFSGGQRQRVCIARALALNPKFIVCDETVSALDVSVQAQVLNLLNELKREFGFTYIFISHDLSVVKFMADRMMVMNKGKIEELGDADEIYNHPQSAYTQKLIAAIPKSEIGKEFIP